MVHEVTSSRSEHKQAFWLADILRWVLQFVMFWPTEFLMGNEAETIHTDTDVHSPRSSWTTLLFNKLITCLQRE